MHDDYDLRQEQLNKASLLSSKKFLENLLEKFNSHVVSQILETDLSFFKVPFLIAVKMFLSYLDVLFECICTCS